MSDSTPSMSISTDATSLTGWLMDRIRLYDQIDPELVTPEAPLPELGLDSIYALTLCGDIEDTYGVPIDPPFLAGFATLRDLAAGLSVRIDQG